MRRMGIVEFTRLMMKTGVQVLSEGVGSADPNALPLALWLLYYTERQVVEKDSLALLVFKYRDVLYVHQDDGAAYAYIGGMLSYASANAIQLACALLQRTPTSINACHLPLMLAKFNGILVRTPPKLTRFDAEHDAGTSVAV